MEWIEVFIATTRDGLEPASGFLYQCGLTGLQIEDNIDFAEFLNDPNREWDYVEDELVEQKAKQELPENIEKIVLKIDPRHIFGTVLRHKQGEKIVVCDGLGSDYYCELLEIDATKIVAKILDKMHCEAGSVTAGKNNIVISITTEFVENSGTERTKQDCESIYPVIFFDGIVLNIEKDHYI